MTMQNYLTRCVHIALAFVVAFLAVAAFAHADDDGFSHGMMAPKGGEPIVACTADAKICPDGTGVGRVGPNCEFAPCPGEDREDKADNIFNRIRSRIPVGTSTSTSAMPMPAQLREEAQERLGEMRKEMDEHRDEMQEAMQNASTTEERRAIMDEARERIEEARGDIQEARKELQERIRAHASQHLQQVMRRLNAMVERLGTLAERIQSRIDKFTEDGMDTADVQDLLDAAEAQIDTAAGLVDDVEALIEEAVASETPKEYNEKVREAVRVAVDAAKTAKKALQDTIRAIKGLATNK